MQTPPASPNTWPQLKALVYATSRTFGLSMRLLPAPVRPSITLAYALARISDSVADTTTAPPAERHTLLSAWAQAIALPNAVSPCPHPAAASLQAFARQCPLAAERNLLAAAPEGLRALSLMAAADQHLIAQTLEAITQGQLWDLAALDSPAQQGIQGHDIERYTWQVAGSVGEFWTRTCELHLTDWRSAEMQQMLTWASAYGQGLQRINIWRDAGADLRAGRCYWPQAALQAVGLDPGKLCAAARSGDTRTLKTMAPVLAAWQRATWLQLRAGLHYSLAVRGWRLRLASALPVLLGIHTWRLLQQAGPSALWTHIKWPRRSVYGLLLRLLICGVSRQAIQAQWAAALRGLPEAEASET